MENGCLHGEQQEKKETREEKERRNFLFLPPPPPSSLLLSLPTLSLPSSLRISIQRKGRRPPPPQQHLELVERHDVDRLDVVALAVPDELLCRLLCFFCGGKERKERRGEFFVKFLERGKKGEKLTFDDRVHRLDLGVLDDGRDLHLLDAVSDRHELGSSPQQALLDDRADLKF
jgi:hypothetical protein